MYSLLQKLITLQILVVCFCVSMNAQRSISKGERPKLSQEIFKSISDSLSNIQRANYGHAYYLKNSPCYKYLFSEDGQISYENECPECYTTAGIIGEYKYSSMNTLDFYPESTAIYHQVVDKIETEDSDGRLSIEIVDEKAKEIGKVSKIYYIQRPTSFFEMKQKMVDRKVLDKIAKKNVIIWAIFVDISESEQRQSIYLPLDWKLYKPRKRFVITVRKNGYQIKKQGTRLFLYKWSYQTQSYEKVDELIHQFR